jgi:predicted small lipoprotein YifL
MKKNVFCKASMALFAVFWAIAGCGEKENPDNEIPEWLLQKIKAMEDENRTDISILKIKVFQVEWKKQTVFVILNNLNSCILCEVYSIDGKHIEPSVDFYNSSKTWTLIYEFGK